VAALRARLADQELERSVCDLLGEKAAEKMKAVQMAARLGRAVGEVYQALRRIRRYMDTIVPIERDEGLRSGALRRSVGGNAGRALRSKWVG
jgi:hypothetical protein